MSTAPYGFADGESLEQITSAAINLLQSNQLQYGICGAMTASCDRSFWPNPYAARKAVRQLTLYFGETLGENWWWVSQRLDNCTTRRGALLRVGFLMLVRRAIRAANLPPLDATTETR